MKKFFVAYANACSSPIGYIYTQADKESYREKVEMKVSLIGIIVARFYCNVKKNTSAKKASAVPFTLCSLRFTFMYTDVRGFSAARR